MTKKTSRTAKKKKSSGAEEAKVLSVGEEIEASVEEVKAAEDAPEVPPEDGENSAVVEELDLGDLASDEEEPESIPSEIEDETADVREMPGEEPFESLGELKAALECLLFTTTHPLSLARLRKLLHKIDTKTLRGVMSQLQLEYDARDSGVQILESAEGYQMCTRPRFAALILQLHRQRKKNPLTTTALETLAIVAYKQPMTRAEIEMIRGVETSGVLRNLCDMGLIKVVGRKEVIGRPQLYGTTIQFLRAFGLKSLNDLPTIQALRSQYSQAPGFLAAAMEGKEVEDAGEPGESGEDDEGPDFSGEEAAVYREPEEEDSLDGDVRDSDDLSD